MICAWLAALSFTWAAQSSSAARLSQHRRAYPRLSLPWGKQRSASPRPPTHARHPTNRKSFCRHSSKIKSHSRYKAVFGNQTVLHKKRFNLVQNESWFSTRTQSVRLREMRPTFNSSTSTFRKTTPGYFLANSAKTGAIIRQGPHHEAVKSTTT